MAPMLPGPRKEPVYTFTSLKSPGRRTPSRFPNGAPMDRDDRLQGILHIFQTPHLLGSPVKEPSPKVPFMEPFTEKCPTTAALLHSPTKVRGIRAPSSLREMPTSRDFPNVSSRVPSEGAPPEANSTEHFQREMPSSKDFPNISSRVPSDGAAPKAPSTEPIPPSSVHALFPKENTHNTDFLKLK